MYRYGRVMGMEDTWVILDRQVERHANFSLLDDTEHHDACLKQSMPAHCVDSFWQSSGKPGLGGSEDNLGWSQSFSAWCAPDGGTTLTLCWKWPVKALFFGEAYTSPKHGFTSSQSSSCFAVLQWTDLIGNGRPKHRAATLL